MEKDGDLGRCFVGGENTFGEVQPVGVGKGVGVGKVWEANRGDGSVEVFRCGQRQPAQKHRAVCSGLGAKGDGVFGYPFAGGL